MATKRRRKTSRRPVAKNATKRRTTKRRTHVTHRTRHANSARRVRAHSRRRRNPISSSTVTEGAKLGVAGIVISFSQKFIRPLVGNFLPSGPIANAGVTLGTAYGLGWLAGFASFTRPYKRYLELAGWTIAATQLVMAYVLPALGNFTSGASAQAGMNGPRRRNGMRGIAAVTGIPPTIVPPPSPPPAAANGMSGFAAIPGRFAR